MRRDRGPAPVNPAKGSVRGGTVRRGAAHGKPIAGLRSAAMPEE